jgi:hypothetical protein
VPPMLYSPGAIVVDSFAHVQPQMILPTTTPLGANSKADSVLRSSRTGSSTCWRTCALKR